MVFKRDLIKIQNTHKFAKTLKKQKYIKTIKMYINYKLKKMSDCLA